MKFAAYAPHFTQMLTTEESVSSILNVINQKSVAAGDGGKFVSHLGNQQVRSFRLFEIALPNLNLSIPFVID